MRKWKDLNAEDLILEGKKVTKKYQDKLLLKRMQILQNYAEETKDEGIMLYIYGKKEDTFLLCSCQRQKSHEIYHKRKEELPQNAKEGSCIRIRKESLAKDEIAEMYVQEELDKLIQEMLEEQERELNEKRIEGHIYEAGEKYSYRIWLYDLSQDSTQREGIEETNFPEELYREAKEGDQFIYQNGTYNLII